MQATIQKAAYVKPTLQPVSLMSNALASLALACCHSPTPV